MDKEIAKNCPEIDVVVGGHTNTFLYTGQQPDAEKIEGPYPTIVVQKNGKKVPVVQAYAYTKYLGQLKLSVSIIGSKMPSPVYIVIYIVTYLCSAKCE